jgi:CDP-6-deoxy-D-xylo-4-hexulose-3-dehydrase
MTRPNSAPSFSWPLAVSPFTWLDRAAIAWWVLRQDRYTMGEKVAELERQFSAYSGAHAVMVANGSLANTLVFELWKVKHPGRRPLVFVPAVTWISSITPALMAGMDIEFCDINVLDFAFDYDKLEAQLRAAKTRGVKDIIIWPTALIGFAPDMRRLQGLATEYGASLYLDSCENTFSRIPVDAHTADSTGTRSILASADMATTSCYLSHQVTSVEAGFVFFRDKGDADLARMFRNHGMARSLPVDHPLRRATEAANPNVDPQFLFALGGTNLRPSDVHAAFGLRDIKRADSARAHRIETYTQFHNELDKELYYLPPLTDTHVGFCLPVFTFRDNLPEVKSALRSIGCEVRPIIGGNLLFQPPFERYGEPEEFPNALWVHTHGTYVGLHSKVTPDMVRRLTDTLNDIR